MVTRLPSSPPIMPISASKTNPPDRPAGKPTHIIWRARLTSAIAKALQVLGALFLLGWVWGFVSIHGAHKLKGVTPGLRSPPDPHQCRPPSPVIPLSSADTSGPAFIEAAAGLDAVLVERSAQPDIDALSIALVTPSGIVFERHYGVLRANETDLKPDGRRKPDSESLYRIASISKMFAVLELLILRENGLLKW